MPIKKLLIANRGEIGVRIARAAANLGIISVAVSPPDDASSLHVKLADEHYTLKGRGAAAYLDMEQLLAVAQQSNCDAVHPGYGFLSESDAFARLCENAGINFVGPTAETLGLLGNKTQARKLAQRCHVPVIPGTDGPTSLEEAKTFHAGLGPGAAVMVKSITGGGGRGMQLIRSAHEFEDAFVRCVAEARRAFGNDQLYLEQAIDRARHIEIQIIGDGKGCVSHLLERECSLQRRNQKVVEVAPAPSLSEDVRIRLADAAVRIASEVNYRGLGTIEFLLHEDNHNFSFMEVNPRLQVEHTVTEAVTGIDLVEAQLKVAGGETLELLGLLQSDIPGPDGYAIQMRINAETMDTHGQVRPAGGILSVFEHPGGPGVRVDTYAYGGYAISPHYDSLLAKLIICHRSPNFGDAVRRAYRTLCQLRVEGVRTNIEFLKNLLAMEQVATNQVHTRFIDEHIKELVSEHKEKHPQLFFNTTDAETDRRGTDDSSPTPEGTTPALASMSGLLVDIHVTDGDTVYAGQPIALIESMKMHHEVTAPVSGTVRQVTTTKLSMVTESQPLAFIEAADLADDREDDIENIDLDVLRQDLAETLEKHAIGLDAARPDSVSKRHSRGKRTARENINDLCDAASFIEYGALTYAAQRRRRSVEDLTRSTPADGLVGGLGTVNGDLFEENTARCMVLAYDSTVLAGTQGIMNHKKLARLLTLAEELETPVITFAEGGGGRPGDTDDDTRATGLNMSSFRQYARLSGLAPRISIVSGRCFAGNAVIAGCSDIIIATADASIGMAGPAMIEGAGLGKYAPEEIGPVKVQAPNGVIDIVVANESEATRTAKQLLSCFQGSTQGWDSSDQRRLRHCIPEDRRRIHDVHAVIETLADTGSTIELRAQFAPNIVTAFIRIEGIPIGLIANDGRHLSGAIDTPGADKASRFMQLCDAFDIPILSLCDTPGFMVGPDAESAALVRHASRLFVTAANLTTPLFSIILRKGYGLGIMGMTGGSFHAPVFNVSWPTGEFGGMGPEGSVRLAYRGELESLEDEAERKALFDKLVADVYTRGKATNVAASLEIDAVIDPAESRHWIARGLRSLKPKPPRRGKVRPMIDTW